MAIGCNGWWVIWLLLKYTSKVLSFFLWDPLPYFQQFPWTGPWNGDSSWWYLPLVLPAISLESKTFTFLYLPPVGLLGAQLLALAGLPFYCLLMEWLLDKFEVKLSVTNSCVIIMILFGFLMLNFWLFISGFVNLSFVPVIYIELPSMIFRFNCFKDFYPCLGFNIFFLSLQLLFMNFGWLSFFEEFCLS